MAEKFREMINGITLTEDKKGFILLDEIFDQLDLKVLSELGNLMFEEEKRKTLVLEYQIGEITTSAIGIDSGNFGMHQINIIYTPADVNGNKIIDVMLSLSIGIQLYVLANSKNVTLDMFTELLKEDKYNAEIYKKVIMLNNKISEDLYLYVRL